MTKRFWVMVLIGVITSVTVRAQEIKLDCKATPLNKILLEWRDAYNMQFSYNDQLLSSYKITIKQTFPSPEKALDAILKGLPLGYEKAGTVYIIFPKKTEEPPQTVQFTGKIVEAGTNEPLPFSHIAINHYQSVTDIKGVFSFTMDADSAYQVMASHLGCFILDTLLSPGHGHLITLTPSRVGLPEVVVTNNIVETATQIGESPGLTTLNHHIANYLPGNGDNSVFNLLRLQPGILAAGEQPNDLIIWGSPEGTSRVLFDGFTIWGLKNFNDNISAVNPYLAKNVNVLKGGYDATNPDVVGGLVNVTGKNGNTQQAGVNFFINNQTMNAMVEFPIQRKSSVIMAFRQTYYDLLAGEDLKYFKNYNDRNPENKVDVFPDYNFKDFNVKYSLQGDNGDLFYVSMLGATDKFSYEAKQDRPNYELILKSKEDNRQRGGTVFYGHTAPNGHSSEFKLSYSALLSHYENRRLAAGKRVPWSRMLHDEVADTDLGEMEASIKNSFEMVPHNKLSLGLAFVHNTTSLVEDTFQVRSFSSSKSSERISLFAQNEQQLGSRLLFTYGLRFNYPVALNASYLDPRLALSLRASGNIKINASWGLYHQFLVKSSVVDDNNNYRYTFTIADNDDVPVMRSQHSVLGAALTLPSFLFSVDTYFKNNEGLTRFVRSRDGNLIYNGISRSYGVDFYAKQDFKGHSVWAAYSLGKTEEHFSYMENSDYRRSPHDQRHEVKLATLLNWRSFHFSASYVYGSGFPLYDSYKDTDFTEPDYNRVDVSLVYHLGTQKFVGEAGISILNLFNNYNVKYNSFERVPVDQLNTIYINTDAVPFTPLLYLKVSI